MSFPKISPEYAAVWSMNQVQDWAKNAELPHPRQKKTLCRHYVAVI